MQRRRLRRAAEVCRLVRGPRGRNLVLLVVVKSLWARLLDRGPLEWWRGIVCAAAGVAIHDRAQIHGDSARGRHRRARPHRQTQQAYPALLTKRAPGRCDDGAGPVVARWTSMGAAVRASVRLTWQTAVRTGAMGYQNLRLLTKLRAFLRTKRTAWTDGASSSGLQRFYRS